MTNKHAVLIYHSNILEQYSDLDSLQPSLQSILQQSYSNYDILELNYGNDTTHIFSNKSTLFWNIKFDTSKKAQNFLLNIAFNKLNYDVIFNIEVGKVYKPDTFEQQIKLINDGYDIVSCYNDNKKPNISKLLNDSFTCKKCNNQVLPVYKDLHLLYHNIRNINTTDVNQFLHILKYCFINSKFLVNSVNKKISINDFSKIDTYKKVISDEIKKIIYNLLNNNNIQNNNFIKKLADYMLIYIFMTIDNNNINEQMNIRWYIENDINLINDKCLCIKNTVKQYFNKVPKTNNEFNPIKLWHLISQTELKFKIIPTVLYNDIKMSEHEKEIANISNIENIKNIKNINVNDELYIKKFKNYIHNNRIEKKKLRQIRKDERKVRQESDRLNFIMQNKIYSQYKKKYPQLKNRQII